MNSPVRPLLQEIEEISGMGFDYLELSMDPPEAHYSLIRDQRKELLKALAINRMKLVCHLPAFLSTADLTQGLRDASLKEVIESLKVAADLKPLKIVLHPSYFSGLGFLVADQAQEYAMNSLNAIVEAADRLGLCLCIENMFTGLRSLADPEDFVVIFERFPSLKMTLDIGHANIGSKGSKKALRFIERFSGRIHHIHASDNFGKEDNHLPIGTGTVDYLGIIEALKGIGYQDTVTLEVFSRDRDYLKISREKLAAMFGAGRA